MLTVNVADVLVGMSYTGSRGRGIIQEAERRDDIWAGSNATAYTVRVRPTFDGVPVADFWATLVVRP
jgi:hypothetical protein